MIQNPNTNALGPLTEERSEAASDPELALIIYSAKWSVAVSLSITIICQTGIALLSRSLDRKGSLKVSNRYVRLLPRMIVVAIIMCLPIERRMTGGGFMTIAACLLLVCLNWEWIASLERDGRVFEP